MEKIKQRIELADIFSRHANDYLKHHQLCPQQQKAFDAIVQCRTDKLGGHINRCDHCGHTRQAYNSCRNRHCPKCQFVKKAQWVDKLAANLPPVRHFHVVFTIPPALHKLFYLNQKIAYSLFFKASGEALMQCASNPRFLGAQAGAVAILHTWGQTLVYHPHIHMIVPAGGLSEDQMEWVPSAKKFFLPVKALSKVFRGILCKRLEKALHNDQIKLPEKADFKAIIHQCYKKPWVVYCEKPFSNTSRLIEYLGNYTHRVAIANNRIIDHSNGEVRFHYKDYRSAGLRRQVSLKAGEFIRRFLQHVLPDGFYKIRYFGFMAMCNMQSKLSVCYDLIGKDTFLPLLEGLHAIEVWKSITGEDPLRCPRCQIGMMRKHVAPPTESFKPG